MAVWWWVIGKAAGVLDALVDIVFWVRWGDDGVEGDE